MDTSTDDTDLLALDQQLCFALAVASRSVVAAYRPILAPLGLTHPQYLVMLALWQDEPRTLAELATSLRLEPATLSPLVKRLEAVGLLTRQRALDDGRQLAVRLTARGRELRTNALLVPPQVVEALGIDVEEQTDLRMRLSAVIDRLRALEDRGE